MIVARVRTPYIWILLVSFLPALIWFLLNDQANDFGMIDSFSLGFFTATISVLLLSLSKKISIAFLCLATLFFSAFTYISFEYFSFYGGYISTETMLLFNDLLTASVEFITPLAAISLLPIFIAIYFISKTLSQSDVNNPSIFKVATVLAVCLFLTSFSHGKYQSLNLNPTMIQKLDLASQNPMLFFVRSSALWRLMHSDDAQRIEHHNFLTLANGLKNGADLTLPKRYKVENYKDLIIDYPSYHSSLSEKRPLTNLPNMILTKQYNQKNVIMIVLESVRAYETSLFDAEYSLTPNLDKISKQGVSLPNFYASNRQTVKAEQALLCSAIDYMGDAPYSLKHGIFNGDCLPKILAQNGYETHWFHGYTKEFFNREQYHKSIGFENIYAKEEFEADGYNSINDIGWGVPDTVLFDTVFKKLERLDKGSKPFFVEVLTLTNHQPFDWDYGELTLAPSRYDQADHKYKNYQKGITYTDKALGQFWEKFKQSKFAKNTVVIITADHGVPFYPSEEMTAAEKREILFRIPFVLIDPDTTEPAVITTQLSQLDVAPTVLSMLDISSKNAFIGRPFYGEAATQANRPILLLSSNGISVRYGDLSCNPVGEMCAAGDNTCKQVGALQCSTHDDSLLKYGQQAVNYHEYLKLALETGFVL